MTGEHGIGLALREMLEEELGQSATDMMRKVRCATTMNLPPDSVFRSNPRSIPFACSIVIKSFEWSMELADRERW